MKNKTTIYLMIGVAVLAIGTFLLIQSGLMTINLPEGQNSIKNADNYDEYAQLMVERCKDSEYRPLCYETEVPKLVTEMSSDKIFEVIRLIRKYDPEYLFCHVLAHDLGSYEVSLDPDNWLDVVAKAPPDGLCSNGFSHGAIVTRFNEEALSPEELAVVLDDLAIACEQREGWNPTDLVKAICYHGVGHVLVHMTEAQIDTSLDACEVVALKDDGRDYRKLCVEGVYMQLYQPLEPEDFALIDQLSFAPTRENLGEFCAEHSNNDSQYGTCWRESWPLFYDELFTVDGVTNYCSTLNEYQDKELCYVSAFTINGRHNLGAPEKMANLCNSMSAEYQGMCFARGANAFPEENPDLVPEAIDMCSRAKTQTAQDDCYSFLAGTASFNFHPGSAPYELMCSSLPEKWESQCRQM